MKRKMGQSRTSGRERVSIGDLATDLVVAIPRLCPQVQLMTFINYRPRPVLEERLKNSKDQSVKVMYAQSKITRTLVRADIPLYDLILGSQLRIVDFQALLDEALYHQPNGHTEQTYPIPVEELTRAKIQEMRRKCGADAALALTSLVKLRDGTNAHLPLMDFRCKCSRQNLNKIVALFSSERTHLPTTGYILKSQRSYHYYGLNVLTETAWLKFLARCLLLGPLADSRYIAHCLLHGKSTLRITESPRHIDTPTVTSLISRL
jgi:hypothetical protein